MRRSLLPETRPELVSGIAEQRFTLPVTQAQNGCLVVFDGPQRCERQIILERLSTGDVEVDGCVGSNGAAQFDIQKRLDVRSQSIAGIFAVNHDLRVVAGETKQRSVSIHQREIHVGSADDSYGLARAVGSRSVDGSQVILRGEIFGSECIKRSIVRRQGECGRRATR